MDGAFANCNRSATYPGAATHTQHCQTHTHGKSRARHKCGEDAPAEVQVTTDMRCGPNLKPQANALMQRKWCSVWRAEKSERRTSSALAMQQAMQSCDTCTNDPSVNTTCQMQASKLLTTSWRNPTDLIAILCAQPRKLAPHRYNRRPRAGGRLAAT